MIMVVRGVVVSGSRCLCSLLYLSLHYNVESLVLVVKLQDACPQVPMEQSLAVQVQRVLGKHPSLAGERGVANLSCPSLAALPASSGSFSVDT